MLSPGGSIAIGVLGGSTLELNVMPAFLQRAVFDSLLTLDPATGALKPGLAESYLVSADATDVYVSSAPRRALAQWRARSLPTMFVATIKAFSDPNFRGTPVTNFGTLTRTSAL